MPSRRALFIRWLPPVLWMSLIFIASTGTLSGEHTSRFVVPFLRWLLGASFTVEKAEFIHFLIRKAGHLTEYAVLCVLFWRALGGLPTFSSSELRRRKRFATAVVLSALYAASDEFHQSFFPSRTANFEDVVIDTVGAVLGLMLFLGLAQSFWKLRHAVNRREPGTAVKPSPDKS